MDDREFRKSIFNRFDSSKPLEPDDPFYLPIYSDSGYDPVDRIAESIQLGSESLNFLSGFRGCGKTTELKRLTKQLKSLNYVVLYADALEFLLPSEPLEVSDFLVTLALAFSESADQAIGAAPGNSLKEGYFTRFVRYLTKTRVQIEGVDAGVELTKAAKLNVKLALKEDPSFRAELRKKLRHVVGEVRTNVQNLVSDVVKQLEVGREGVVFILDNFEQFRDQVGETATVVTSISSLLDNHRAYFKLDQVHCIYTIPPWVKFTIPGAGLKNNHMLYNVKINKYNDDGDGIVDKVGFDKMRNVVFKRLNGPDFVRFFGSYDTTQLDRLIHNSGGHFSDLINLMQDAIRNTKDLPVTPDGIGRVINEYRARFSGLPSNYAAWLHRIGTHRDTMLMDNTPESVRQMSLFLDQHYVMIYFNGEEWYDIHPIIRDEVAEIVARDERLAAVKAEKPA